MEKTIVIYECATAGYGDRIFFSADLIQWAKDNAPGMWGDFDKAWSLDGIRIYGFEYPDVRNALQYQEKSIDDVLDMAEKENFNILFAQDVKGRFSSRDPRWD